MTNPFADLGLDPAAAVSDNEVRAAWRRIAEATHPDRADGGDPERFARAAAAYTELRTTSGRGEARAALAESARPAGIAARAARFLPGWARRRRSRAHAGRPPSRAGRLIAGRPGRLALRIVLTAAASAAAVLAAGPGPAGPALVTGAATWLLLTARRDLGRGD